MKQAKHQPGHRAPGCCPTARPSARSSSAAELRRGCRRPQPGWREHHAGAGGKRGEPLAQQVPEPAADPVADDRPADGAADHETDAGWPGVGTGREVYDEGRDAPRVPPRTVAVNSVRRTHACRGRQHGRPARQAESRARPLRRRPARMARPARVRMRRRKPWVFARRRLFGWNVRLLTEELPHKARPAS